MWASGKAKRALGKAGRASGKAGRASGKAGRGYEGLGGLEGWGSRGWKPEGDGKLMTNIFY